MWDSTGSHWSGVRCKVPEMMRMVSLSCLSTSLALEGRPHACMNTVLSNRITQRDCRGPECLSVGSPRRAGQFGDYVEETQM